MQGTVESHLSDVKSSGKPANTFHSRVWSEQQLAAVGRRTLLQQRASSAGLELRCPSVSHRLTFKACHFTGRPAASNPTWQLSSSMTLGNLFSQSHSRQRHYRSIKVISRWPDEMSAWITPKKWTVLTCCLELKLWIPDRKRGGKGNRRLCGTAALKRRLIKRRTWRIRMLLLSHIGESLHSYSSRYSAKTRTAECKEWNKTNKIFIQTKQIPVKVVISLCFIAPWWNLRVEKAVPSADHWGRCL